MESGSLCLVDAMVLVDAVKYGFLDALLDGHSIGAARAVLREARFYRDDSGQEHAIDLQPQVASGKLSEVSAAQTEVDAVVMRLQRRLGAGEIESIALVVARGHRLCTADKPAVRAMKNLGILDRWVPLEDLLRTLNPPRSVPEAKYLRTAVESKLRRASRE